CLSPCADNDMTPNNICGMAVLGGLNIVALTDHNSCKNCPAFFAAAEKNGLIPVAGMELTSAEDIHMICLFEELSDAMEFDSFVDSKRVKIRNRTDIFGEQLITDELDEITGTDEFLLPNATVLTVDEIPAVAGRFNGLCYPAHVDRQANGIIATLGTFPEELGVGCAEFHDKENIGEYREKYKGLGSRRIIVSSDAHYLWDIRDREAFFEIDDEPYSSRKVRSELFKILRGEKQ
ncbi:MAG: PHP domain-containing protein, partial [Acutalibacteraceae bacterium]